MRYSRQNKILELINSHEIGTQEDLATLLRESGFNVTQATVSRDIKELQLVKVLSSKGKYKYASRQSAEQPPSDRFTKIFRETITSFDSSGNIIVVKTLSGCANAAGEAIDSSGMDHIIGSIAGDNTMFLLVDSEENVPLVLEKFREMLDTRSAK
ncbi:MAG: arginine repressor [Anaerovoracaceae bacterium]|nr:arginine repressor [Anaerovoracaceae bacterium]